MYGEEYPSVEHAYQACKTMVILEREMIRLAPTPGAAKEMGRRVTLRPDFNEKKLGFMEILLRRKFAQQCFKVALSKTGRALIQEGNHWNDTFWGVDLRTGLGRNELGKLIMKIRRGE